MYTAAEAKLGPNATTVRGSSNGTVIAAFATPGPAMRKLAAATARPAAIFAARSHSGSGFSGCTLTAGCFARRFACEEKRAAATPALLIAVTQPQPVTGCVLISRPLQYTVGLDKYFLFILPPLILQSRGPGINPSSHPTSGERVSATVGRVDYVRGDANDSISHSDGRETNTERSS